MTVTQTPSFGELLRRNRLAAGLTQEALADQAGLSAHAISDLERGVRRAPYRETVRLLAGALGLDVADRAAMEAAVRRSRGTPMLAGRSADAADASNDWASPFVGRARELGLLQGWLGSTLAGRGGVVLLAGEAGIGKTRLVQELAAEAVQRGVRVLWGRCWENEGAPPFWPWVQILRGVLRSDAVRPPPIEPGPSRALLAELVPELRESALGGPDLPPAPVLEAEEARFRLFDAAASLLGDVARSQPLLLALDDLHWADKPSLLLLQFLLQHLGEARILVVGAYRDVELEQRHPLTELLPSLRRERNFEQMALRRLSAEAVTDLVLSFLGQPSGAAEQALALALWQETEGNPLFVLEALRYLIENERLVRREGRWDSAAATLAEVGLAEGVRDVLGRRLARLSEQSNELLTLASVAGREFDAATLERLSGIDGEALDRGLDEAEAAQIIEPMPEASGRYRFSHALYREALYSKLPTRRRMRLHQQMGEALEERYARDPEPHLPELAHHFLQALPGGDAAKAITYTQRAGERALASYAYEEAVRHYEAALRVLAQTKPSDAALRVDLLLSLGGTLTHAGELPRVVEVITPEALTLAESTGDGARAARVARLALDAIVRYGPGLSRATRRYWTETALRYAAPGSGDRAYADAMLGRTETFAGRADVGVPLILRAVQVARDLGDADAFQRAVELLLHWGRPEDAGEQQRLAEELAARPREQGSPRRWGEALWACAYTLLNRGERERTETLWSEVVELARHAHDASRGSLIQPVWLAALDGDLESSVALAPSVIEQAAALGMGLGGQQFATLATYRPLLYLGRGEQALSDLSDFLGRWRAERQVLHEALQALCLAHLDRRTETERLLDGLLTEDGVGSSAEGAATPTLALLLEAAVLIEHRRAAAVLAQRLAPLARIASGTAMLVPTCVGRHLGAAALLLGNREAAFGYTQHALELAVKMRYRPEIALTRLQLAELTLDQGSLGARHAAPHQIRDQAAHADALDHLDCAIAEFRQMHMRPALERALRCTARIYRT